MFAILIGFLAVSFSSDVLAGRLPPGFPLPSADHSQADIGAVSGFPSLYQSQLSKFCSASIQCVAQFTAVPSNQLLQATNVNCFGEARGNTQANFVLFSGPTTSPNHFDFFVVLSRDQFRLSMNETILNFFEATVRPKMALGVDNSAGLSLTCTLTGTLLTPHRIGGRSAYKS